MASSVYTAGIAYAKYGQRRLRGRCISLVFDMRIHTNFLGVSPFSFLRKVIHQPTNYPPSLLVHGHTVELAVASSFNLLPNETVTVQTRERRGDHTLNEMDGKWENAAALAPEFSWDTSSHVPGLPDKSIIQSSHPVRQRCTSHSPVITR